MGTKRKKLDEDPAWKKRRRELDRAMRRAKMWKILGWTLGVAALALYVGLSIRGALLPVKKPNQVKQKPRQGIAKVVGKHTASANGREEYYVTFHVGRWTTDSKVDRAKYDSLKKGQEVLLRYDVSGIADAVRVRDWEPVKLAKPMSSEKRDATGG